MDNIRIIVFKDNLESACNIIDIFEGKPKDIFRKDGCPTIFVKNVINNALEKNYKILIEKVR